MVVWIPAILVRRLEPLDREGTLDDFSGLGKRATVPVATIWTATFPSAVASTAGEHRAPGRVGRELIQEAITRSATDDLNLRNRLAGKLLERLDTKRYLKARLSRIARVKAGGQSGSCCPVSRQYATMAETMRPGGERA